MPIGADRDKDGTLDVWCTVSLRDRVPSAELKERMESQCLTM